MAKSKNAGKADKGKPEEKKPPTKTIGKKDKKDKK